MADLGTLLIDGDGSSPRAWSSQASTSVDDGISGADGVEIAAATVSQNRATTLGTTFTLDNTPGDFGTMDSPLSFNVRYRANDATGDDTLVFRVAILKANGDVLAGATTGASGTLQVVKTDLNTAWHTSLQNLGSTAFTNVDTGASKADWDAAVVIFESEHQQEMSPDDNWVIIDSFELGGTYTTGSAAYNEDADASVAVVDGSNETYDAGSSPVYPPVRYRPMGVS